MSSDPGAPRSPFRYRVFFYRTLQGNEPVRRWLQELPKMERRIVGEAIQALQMVGPAFEMPYVRPLGARLWELRERIGKVRYRVFYLFDGPTTVVLLHAAKKDQRTIGSEIALAHRRGEDYFERKKGEKESR